ncbi:6-phosphogluconolactonase [Dyadobacter sp. CECT 9623]|uniref:6-phosphogluconolactonase n=1 Tax=Dyadobacter linearis TaxID=2823330 RepID=A0ABN7RFQ0_9BACT|nr:lactonase family protein [Dyadobacter sp. CECT 9623]CAG5070578.1 6-phosphogluconolactonase [Dyadobacter sp. CECT 9623]
MMKKLILPFLLAAASLMLVSFQDKTIPFYIGTQDKGANSSITLCELNLSTGQITVIDTFNNSVGPGYVAISSNKKFLYAAGGNNKIDAYAIGGDKKLTYLNSQSSEGANPCHVAVHPSGKMVLAANYTGGSFSAYPATADGKLGAPSYTEQYTGTGPNEKRQEKAHAHFATASPDGKYVYVTDLGSDKVMNYVVDSKANKLIPNPAQPFFSGKPGAGPRHLIIHPSGKSLFLLNELEASLTACTIDKKGVITAGKTYPTIPTDFSGANTSAAIHLHPNGKFVYVSNRGHNSITGFAIKADGDLEMIDQQTKSIATPRDFNIDPSGKIMIVANQSTDNLVVYDIDQATGKFTFKHESIAVKSPICVAFL